MSDIPTMSQFSKKEDCLIARELWYQKRIDALQAELDVVRKKADMVAEYKSALEAALEEKAQAKQDEITAVRFWRESKAELEALRQQLASSEPELKGANDMWEYMDKKLRYIHSNEVPWQPYDAWLRSIDNSMRELGMFKVGYTHPQSASVDELVKALINACTELLNSSQEYEFDDGVGKGALQEYWDDVSYILDELHSNEALEKYKKGEAK